MRIWWESDSNEGRNEGQATFALLRGWRCAESWEGVAWQRSTLATATHAHRWGVLRDEYGRTRVSWSKTSVMVVAGGEAPPGEQVKSARCEDSTRLGQEHSSLQARANPDIVLSLTCAAGHSHRSELERLSELTHAHTHRANKIQGPRACKIGGRCTRTSR